MDNVQSAGNTAMRWTAWILVGLGAIVIVAMRGCSSLQKRGAMSAFARYQSAQTEFRDKWQDKRADLERRQRELNERIRERREEGNRAKKNFREIEDSVKDLNQDLSDVSKNLMNSRRDEQKERDELLSGSWRDLRKTSRKRAYGFATWGYVRQWVLIPSVAVLFAGLLLLAKFGSRAESLMGLVMIGVILYSLFMGGELWADSPFDSTWSMNRGL